MCAKIERIETNCNCFCRLRAPLNGDERGQQFVPVTLSDTLVVGCCECGFCVYGVGSLPGGLTKFFPFCV